VSYAKAKKVKSLMLVIHDFLFWNAQLIASLQFRSVRDMCEDFLLYSNSRM